MKIRRISTLLPAAAMLTLVIGAACSSGSHKDGIALTGTFATDSIEDFVLSFNEESDMQRNRSITIRRDAEGNFQIPDSLIPASGVRAQLLADDCGYFGVWLEPGKTAHIDIAGSPSQGFTATFSGENADINDLVNDITTSYDIMVYTPQDPSERMSKTEALQLLNGNRKRIADKAAKLNDEKDRNFYSRLSEQMADRMEGFVIEDEAYDMDADPFDNPRYQQLVAGVNPNEVQALESGMIYLWLNSQVRDTTLTGVKKSVSQMDVIDRNVNDSTVRKALYNSVGAWFFGYSKPSPEDASEFIKAYGERAKDYPDFIDRYTLMSQGVKEIKLGDTISYDPTIATIDGKTCKLSDLYGRLLYIDFWATWCGPCCKQIPHLERLVEEMKETEGIEFISISCDADTNAWKAKVAKDNPQWPQYIFADGDGERFMTAMNITGIPRFMIIGPDGKIINPEAPMPSDPKLADTLRSYLK